MDLSTLVGDTFACQTPPASRLCLVLSHSTSSHEPVLCDLISQVLKSGQKPSIPSGDSPPSRTYILLIALHKSAQFYNRLLGQTFMHMDSKSPLKIVDLTTSEHLTPVFDAESALGLKMLDRIREEVNTLLDQASQNQPSTVQIFIDNLTCLIDLGCSLRKIDNLLSQWLNNSNCPFLVTVGLHMGLDYKDDWASESEPSLVHAIQLWKARSAMVIEMQPLSTGYTASVDGQISIYKQRPNSYCQTVQELNQLFHYKYEGKRVQCYAPGTSKLLT